jgi:hypothetical protein
VTFEAYRQTKRTFCVGAFWSKGRLVLGFQLCGQGIEWCNDVWRRWFAGAQESSRKGLDRRC